MIDHGALAKEYFLKGYNCSQAVLISFSDLTGLDEAIAMKLSSSFGGGMGRMREVCGAVSGALMVLGILCGYDATSPTADADKKSHYARVQEFCKRFRDVQSSIVCREILQNHAKKLQEMKKAAEEAQLAAMHANDASPTPRTAEYYEVRPCAEACALAASLLDEYLQEEGYLFSKGYPIG